MRKIIHNNHGSAVPVIIFIIVLAVASFTILILSEVFEPFMNLMESSDDSVSSSVSAPRGWVSSFFQILYPKGLLLGILIGSGIGLIMEYQKIRYKEMI